MFREGVGQNEAMALSDHPFVSDSLSYSTFVADTVFAEIPRFKICEFFNTISPESQMLQVARTVASAKISNCI
jgi:hypothetical protein